jgi:hypothetical protein
MIFITILKEKLLVGNIQLSLLRVSKIIRNKIAIRKVKYMTIERIKGGWSKVPDHLKCRSQLKELGLVPTGEPVAEVWNSYNWIKLFDIRETREKRKPTSRQLAALQRGREILEELRTCKCCGYRAFHKHEIIEGLCLDCLEQECYYKGRYE